MKKLFKKPLLAFILAILILLVGIAVNFYYDYITVNEIGKNFTEVFFTNFQAKLFTQSITFAFTLILVYLSFLMVKVNLTKLDESFSYLKKKFMIFVTSFFTALVISGIVQSALYDRLLLFLNPSSFQYGDPIFFKDIGYYIFQRQFLISLCNALLGIFGFIAIAVFLLYVFLFLSSELGRLREMLKTDAIVLHNVINVSILITIKAISYVFEKEEILFADGDFTGAKFTDITVWMNLYKIAPILLIVISLLAIIFIYRGKIKLSIATIAIYPIVFSVFGIAAVVTENLLVKPAEIAKEAPYIENNINYTRKAYGIDNVEHKDFNIEYNLNEKNLALDTNSISNVRVIDYNAALKAVNQVQGIRNFYKFNDIDIVTYDINGRPTAVGISARELNPDSENLSAVSNSFANRRLRFTHGFAAAVMQVNQVTSEGLPAFITKDIPPQSVEGTPEITQPRIYFGERTNDYVIVNSGYKELDYTDNDQDIEFSYDGQAGIKLSPFNRLLFSLYNRDYQMFFSNYVTNDSKILLNRNIVKRVQTAAPFLTVDSDPFLLIDTEGKLKWIVNCYTTSENYPYAEYVDFGGQRVNYVRNSARAVVDAYDGTVKFYICDENDPVIQSYKKIYPSFFEESPFPSDLAEHLQYPENLFKVQAQIFKRYHVTDGGMFYNKTDNWDFAKEKYQAETKYVDPYYNMTSLFSTKDELTLMIPYTMENKDNLVAWLGVSSDPSHYGKMILYTFPKGENVYGTMQIENRIDNDPAISRELTLWGQGGSTVIRGNMLVIPVNNSLIYMEPIYITSSGESTMPELKRVVVAYSDSIVMEESFEKAIQTLFNFTINRDTNDTLDYKPSKPATPQTPPEEPDTPAEDLTDNSTIVETFDAIKKAMSENNWQEFGENFTKLEEEINKLRETEEKSTTEENKENE
ncbi:MAG: UPF0182 family protein [Clostridia bacterium]|nr:UPF0182 family protein [Clostridia bacterium]